MKRFISVACFIVASYGLYRILAMPLNHSFLECSKLYGLILLCSVLNRLADVDWKEIFGPRHTVESGAKELAEGLEKGGIEL